VTLDPSKRRGVRTAGSRSRAGQGRARLKPRKVTAEIEDPRSQPAIQRLQEKLKAAQDELRTTVEEMETANEELRVSNEEVLSMNEQLHSLNEALTALNLKLEQKNLALTETGDDLANLLRSAEVGIVILDRQLRIKRFTKASQKIMHLTASDIGRPISDMAHDLIDVDLEKTARQVLENLAAVHRQIRDRSGEWYILKVFPYRTAENSIQGVVVKFTEVTELLETARRLELRERQQEFVAALGRRALAGELPQRLMEEASEALAHNLGADLACLFLRPPQDEKLLLRASAGWRTAEERDSTPPLAGGGPVATGFRSAAPLIFKDLAGDPRFSSRDSLAGQGVTSGALVRIEGREAPLGMLGVFTREARAFTPHDVNFLQAIAAVLAEAIARQDIDTERLLRNRELEEEVGRRTAWIFLLSEITRSSNEAESLDQAMHYALEKICLNDGWQFGQSYLRSRADPEVLTPFESWLDRSTPRFAKLGQACLAARPRKGQGFLGRILDSGEVAVAGELAAGEEPVLAPLCRELGIKAVLALPVRVERETVAVLQFFSVNAASRGDLAMLDLFVHVGTQLGRVVERARFQEASSEAILKEHKRLSEELHDNVGQELAGISLMTSALRQKAQAAGRGLLKVADEVTQGVQRASEKVRNLAHGLYPLEVDAQGLAPALERLAKTIGEAHGIRCRASCEGPIGLSDDRTALQLFRIAQESVTNAVRYARAREIFIDLRRQGGFLILVVGDDGVGIGDAPRDGKGLGLRLMRNRASAIGAALTVNGAPGTGTTVTCALPLLHDPPDGGGST
jgi:signal transduction histidine kinase/PAS domain-containing protein